MEEIYNISNIIIVKYPGIEEFLEAVECGKAMTTKKRKTAMDYIRFLNRIGVNPITWAGDGETVRLKNPLSKLKDLYGIDIDNPCFNRMEKFQKWYRNDIWDVKNNI